LKGKNSLKKKAITWQMCDFISMPKVIPMKKYARIYLPKLENLRNTSAKKSCVAKEK
jgi:hypothetical protein